MAQKKTPTKSVEELQGELQALIARGRKEGMIRSSELNALLEQMDLFAQQFGRLREMLEAEDVEGMRSMMRHSTARRALFDKK